MARSQLDFRKNVNDSESSSSSGVVGAFGGAPPGSTILAPMEIASRDSSSFGTRAEGEPVAVLVHRGRPTPSVRPNALPGQDVGVPEQDWGNHVSYLWSSPRSSNKVLRCVIYLSFQLHRPRPHHEENVQRSFPPSSPPPSKG